VPCLPRAYTYLPRLPPPSAPKHRLQRCRIPQNGRTKPTLTGLLVGRRLGSVFMFDTRRARIFSSCCDDAYLHPFLHLHGRTWVKQRANNNAANAHQKERRAAGGRAEPRNMFHIPAARIRRINRHERNALRSTFARDLDHSNLHGETQTSGLVHGINAPTLVPAFVTCLVLRRIPTAHPYRLWHLRFKLSTAPSLPRFGGDACSRQNIDMPPSTKPMRVQLFLPTTTPLTDVIFEQYGRP